MVVNTSKQLLAQELDQENVSRVKAEGSLRDITKQYQMVKLKLEVYIIIVITFSCN